MAFRASPAFVLVAVLGSAIAANAPDVAHRRVDDRLTRIRASIHAAEQGALQWSRDHDAGRAASVRIETLREQGYVDENLLDGTETGKTVGSPALFAGHPVEWWEEQCSAAGEGCPL